MKTPVEKRFTGTIAITNMYAKFADVQMEILERDMEFGKLKKYQRIIRMEDGTVVSCYINYGIRRINIHHEEEHRINKYKVCFCNCSFAVGVVVGPTESPNKKLYPSPNLRLDVLVCQGRYRYGRFNDCLGSDFTRYSLNSKNENVQTEHLVDEEGWGFDERPWEGAEVVVLLDNHRSVDNYLTCCSWLAAEAVDFSFQTACLPTKPPTQLYPTFRVVPIVSLSMPRTMKLTELFKVVKSSIPHGVPRG